MISFGCEGGKPESYKSYKNRTVTKHKDKIKNQLQQIKSCSLKQEDKDKLIKSISDDILSQLNTNQGLE